VNKRIGAGKGKEAKYRYTDDPLKNRLKKNTLTNMVFFILTLPLMFILTPLILKFTGKEAYGIWVLAGSILVFIELFAGLQTPAALSILVPSYNPKRQAAEINRLVNTMFFFYAATGALTALIFFAGKGVLLDLFFKVSAEMAETAAFVLSFSVYAFLINFVMLGFAYLMGAFSIFYISNTIRIVSSFSRAALIVGALYAGFGIKGVVVSQMAVLILETAAIIFYTKKVFRPLDIGFKYFSFVKLREMISLGCRLFFSRAAGLISANIDKLMIGYFINPVTAAYYHIGASVSKYVSNIPEILGLYSILPASAELHSKNQREKLIMLYNRANKYLFFLAVFITGGIAVLGEEFVSLWLGPGYEKVFIVMLVLAAGYTFGLLGYIPMNMLNGIKRVNEVMYVSIGASALNILLSVVLIWLYGLNGALVSAVISIVLYSLALYFLFSGIFKCRINILDALIKPALAACAAGGAVLIVNRFPGMHEGWLVFFSKAAAYTVSYGLVSVFVLAQFDSYDIEQIKEIFRKKRG